MKADLSSGLAVMVVARDNLVVLDDWIFQRSRASDASLAIRVAARR